jgi:hypothetical protein
MAIHVTDARPSRGRSRSLPPKTTAVLQHATRGTQRAEDVARNNAHDGYHQAWDIERILEHARNNGNRSHAR